MTNIAPPTEQQSKAIKAFQSAVNALAVQTDQPVFDPLELHCCVEDVRDSLAEVLSLLEVKADPDPATPQLPPQPNSNTPIADLVVADMEARKQAGVRKYGTPLQAHYGRDALMDAYQEALDLVVYLRQVIEERK